MRAYVLRTISYGIFRYNGGARTAEGIIS